MTYDIDNIRLHGCLENRRNLSNSAPGFKVTQKFIVWTIIDADNILRRMKKDPVLFLSEL